MKIVAFLVGLVGAVHAFSPSQPKSVGTQTTALHATANRRQFAQQAAAVIGGATLVFGNAAPAFAGARGADYVPKFDDLKVLYSLGMSLDRLVNKFSNEDTVEAGLSNVAEFNKQPYFYPGYAKNYVSKMVLNNADADPRVGYIKQVRMSLRCLFDVVIKRHHPLTHPLGLQVD